MKYPDTVTRLRPSAEDEYGNPAASWASPDSKSLRAFVIEKTSSTVNGDALDRSLLMPPDADVRDGDRLVVRGVTYLATPALISSPSKAVLFTVALSVLPGSP